MAILTQFTMKCLNNTHLRRRYIFNDGQINICLAVAVSIVKFDVLQR